MPEEVKHKWWTSLLNIQSIALILSGVVSLVLFWNTVKNHSADIDVLKKEMLQKADSESLKDIDDKLTRQYGVQRTQNEKEEKQIEEALDWIEFEKGRQEGLKQSKNK